MMPDGCLHKVNYSFYVLFTATPAPTSPTFALCSVSPLILKPEIRNTLAQLYILYTLGLQLTDILITNSSFQYYFD